MKKITALLLCLALALTLCGCGGSKTKDLIVGQWESDVDLTSSVEESLVADESASMWAEMGIENISDYIKLSPATLKVTVDLTEDNKIAFDYDRDSFDTAIDTLFDDVIAGIVLAMEDVLKKTCVEEGITLDLLYSVYDVTSVEELLPEILGMSMDDLKAEMISECKGEMESEMEAMLLSGTYEVKGNSVIGTFEGEAEIEELVYDAESDTLTETNNDISESEIVFHRAG